MAVTYSTNSTNLSVGWSNWLQEQIRKNIHSLTIDFDPWSRYLRRVQRLNRKIDELATEMNNFSNSVTSNTTQDEINDARDRFTRKINRIKRQYDRLERNVDKNHLGMKTSGILAISGGIRQSSSVENGVLGSNEDLLSYVYFSNLTPPISTSAVILSTSLNVNLISSGNFSMTIFGASNIPLRGGFDAIANPNILHSNSSFSGSYNNTFTNASPANPTQFRSILNSGSNAGFGIRALQPYGGIVTGTFSITLTVNYFIPFSVQHDAR
jgi:hypothetical protein